MATIGVVTRLLEEAKPSINFSEFELVVNSAFGRTAETKYRGSHARCRMPGSRSVFLEKGPLGGNQVSGTTTSIVPSLCVSRLGA
jgi:hypothetical protein